jgi:nitrous oxidase accessory protein NosD
MKWMRIAAMTAFVAAVAIGLAFSLGLWGKWTAGAAGTERIVNSGTGASDPAPCNTPNFASVSDIETVIEDSNVQNGDTLVLCPGTYTAGAAAGAVDVDKELTITGLATADREDVVVQGTAASHGFTIKADNVKIKHLKLAGPGAAGAEHGIDIGPVGPTAYKKAELTDLEITTWGEGIHIISSSDAKIGPNNDIHGNNLGVLISSGALGGQGDKVFNNVIGPNTAVGIVLGQIDEAYVQENTLAGNAGAQIDVQGESNALIWNNNIEATTNVGIHISSTTADTLVQIGGSASHANNFTGTLAPGVGFYVKLECTSENTVDATYNYWNGINSNAGIKDVVFNDEFDDPPTAPDCGPDVKGAVVVHPFVTTMWTPTPTPTPSPTPAATGTPTPTPTGTPGATRTVNLSPQGWQTLVWSGANATDPAVALGLSCLSGKYTIAYEWVGSTQQWLRYVPGNSLLSSITVVNKYDSLLVLITAAGVTCDVPIAP